MAERPRITVTDQAYEEAEHTPCEQSPQRRRSSGRQSLHRGRRRTAPSLGSAARVGGANPFPRQRRGAKNRRRTSPGPCRCRWRRPSTPRPAEPAVSAAWEAAGRLSRRRERAAGRRAVLHPAAAAERHRQPAHGPRLQPHADGHPRALAPDAGRRRALAAGPRPCRHRHADGRRARARPHRQHLPPRDGARGLRRQGLGVEGAVGRHHPRAVAPARGFVRPVAQPLHDGRGLPRRGSAGVRRVLPQGADLSRQAAGQLGPAFRDGDLRSRGRAGRDEGPPLAAALSAGGRRDLRASGRLGRRGQADRVRDARLPRRRDHPARDDARRHRGRGAPRRPALRPSGRQDGAAAAGRALDPDRRGRLRRPGEGDGRGQDHAGARLQRLGCRPAAEPARRST